MAQPLLEGDVDRRDAIIEQLTRERDSLREEVIMLRAERQQEIGEHQRSVANLKKILMPLYQGLKLVFGEMDSIALEEDIPTAASIRRDGVWESWKAKLGGKAAEFITAMQKHGGLTAVQLKVMTHSGQQTVYDVTSKLHKLGLIDRRDGKYSLKDI